MTVEYDVLVEIREEIVTWIVHSADPGMDETRTELDLILQILTMTEPCRSITSDEIIEEVKSRNPHLFDKDKGS